MSVFDHGPLSASYHYLDMELCDINLESWIERKWTEEIEKKLAYLTGDFPSRMRMAQIWDVMEDVTSAVGFIHSQNEIHRDLKPRNSNALALSIMLIPVLYSHKDQAWKIADFGITSEGTSRNALTTRYSRGTSSYRAPELIRDGKYTNKIDIWAIGCIFYELVFKSKAFSGDASVLNYALDNISSGHILSLPFEPDIVTDEARKVFISRIILQMLNTDPFKRPEAEQVYKRFIGWRGDESPTSPFPSLTSMVPTADARLRRNSSEEPGILSTNEDALTRQVDDLALGFAENVHMPRIDADVNTTEDLGFASNEDSLTDSDGIADTVLLEANIEIRRIPYCSL